MKSENRIKTLKRELEDDLTFKGYTEEEKEAIQEKINILDWVLK